MCRKIFRYARYVGLYDLSKEKTRPNRPTTVLQIQQAHSQFFAQLPFVMPASSPRQHHLRPLSFSQLRVPRFEVLQAALVLVPGVHVDEVQSIVGELPGRGDAVLAVDRKTRTKPTQRPLHVL